jgi:hypothetical protein
VENEFGRLDEAIRSLSTGSFVASDFRPLRCFILVAEFSVLASNVSVELGLVVCDVMRLVNTALF